MSNISRERIIETAANLSNKAGLENLSLKMIAEELKIKSPSLYNHVSSLDDIKKQLMLYGWKQIETLTIEAAVGVTGYEALKPCVMHFMIMQLIIKESLQRCFGITNMKVLKKKMQPENYLK